MSKEKKEEEQTNSQANNSDESVCTIDKDESKSEEELISTLDQLDPNCESDTFAAFMVEGISSRLKKQALRKLFSAKDFNILDGLDDYAEDFTRPEKLGDILTSDKAFEVVKKIEEKLKVEETVALDTDLDALKSSKEESLIVNDDLIDEKNNESS